ncbi:MAG: hypothetical protein VSS75_023060 [Candidatus Parabeggiatoa sp.]|nr:hypothetical protein [Candidatus Parabeggiatoa sp.]
MDTFDFTKVDISSRKIAKDSKKSKVENRKQGKPIKESSNYNKILHPDINVIPGREKETQ